MSAFVEDGENIYENDNDACGDRHKEQRPLDTTCRPLDYYVEEEEEEEEDDDGVCGGRGAAARGGGPLQGEDVACLGGRGEPNYAK